MTKTKTKAWAQDRVQALAPDGSQTGAPGTLASSALAVRAFACLMVAVLALAVSALLPASAQARDWVDTENAACSLTLKGAPADVPGGVTFDVYRVADVLKVGDEYAFTDDFKAYEDNVSLEHTNQDIWRGVAEYLYACAARDGVKPSFRLQSDEDGVAMTADLSTGLYLVVGHPCSDGAVSYAFDPFLVQLPSLDTTNGTDTWVYDVTSNLKYGVDEEVQTELSAVKVWSDGDSTARPASIDVQLLRDGKVFDTQTLNADNNWRYSWKALEPGYAWRVVEADVPAGYTVSIDREGGVCTITNTIAPDTPGTPTKPGDDKLPQTGMLWWPVPVLVVVGLALVVAGLYRRGSSRKGR